MKEIKKGYRLTDEEEAILRGEIPAEEVQVPSEEKTDRDDPAPVKSMKGKALSALFPLLGLFVLMIAIAYLFMWLLDTPERRQREAEKQQATGQTAEPASGIVIPEEQKAFFTEELALTQEESAAFWPLYVHYCGELEEIRRTIAFQFDKRDSLIASGYSQERLDSMYHSGTQELMNLYTRFSDGFSVLLGEERAGRLMILYDLWNGGRAKLNP